MTTPKISSLARKKTFLERLWTFVSLNIGTKTISVVMAIVVWGIVLGSRNIEVTKEIPLELITPADIIPGNDIPDRIAFRLSGPKAFLRSVLDRKEEPIRVNLSGAKPALITYRFFSDNIRVPIGVKVLSINPAAILIKLEYLKRKEVPIHLDLQGTPPDGFRIVKTEVKPELIRIKGPESKVDGITEVLTAPIDLTHLKRSLDKEVPLDLLRYNVQLDSALPRAFIEVEPLSANFRIKNVDIRVLSRYKTRVEEKSVTVFVQGSSEDIQNLDRDQIFGLIDLTDRTKGKYIEPVKVTLPKNIGLVKVVPDHVNVTLY